MIQTDSEKMSKKRSEPKSQTHSEEPKQVCASTIMKMDIEKDMFRVGGVFMRKYYTIFDRDNDRVGLALAN